MSDFDEYLKAVLEDAEVLLDNTIGRGKEEARAILEAHVENSKDRLKRWTRLLANKDITEREYKLLINSQITLSRMRLRTVQVIGKKAALEFRDKLRRLFIDKAFEIFL